MTERKVILDLAISLDGYIEGPNGEVDWCIMEPEMDFPKFLSQIDTIFYGRKSYDKWGQHKPHRKALKSDQIMWTLIHSKKKYVFSRTAKSGPKGVTYIRGDLAAEVTAIKEQPGKDIWLYGGSELIESFMHLNLIDEYRLSIHPVVLGGGKPLFPQLENRLALTLKETKPYASGIVQMIYEK